MGFAKILESTPYRMKWIEATSGDYHCMDSVKSLFDFVKKKTKHLAHPEATGVRAEHRWHLPSWTARDFSATSRLFSSLCLSFLCLCFILGGGVWMEREMEYII